MVDVGRRQRERVADHLAHLGQRYLKFRILDCVFLGEPGNLLRRILYIVIEDQSAPVRRQRDYADIRPDQPEPVFLQLHVAENVWPKRTRSVRENGTAEA